MFFILIFFACLQRLAVADALRLAGFERLLHRWRAAATVELRAHAARFALEAAAAAAAKAQADALAELTGLLRRGNALSPDDAKRVQVTRPGLRAPIAHRLRTPRAHTRVFPTSPPPRFVCVLAWRVFRARRS
jgi:hypothetical protein